MGVFDVGSVCDGAFFIEALAVLASNPLVHVCHMALPSATPLISPPYGMWCPDPVHPLNRGHSVHSIPNNSRYPIGYPHLDMETTGSKFRRFLDLIRQARFALQDRG